jgi:superfamily II DNA or RNA helicase
MKILVFCSDKKFFEKIARIFSVPFISSKTSSCEKELILSNFKTDNQKNILVMSRVK